MTEVVEEKTKVEVDYDALMTTEERGVKRIDFFDYLAERATEALVQIFTFVWPLVLLGFFSTITLVGVLIFAEGLTLATSNIVLAWVLIFLGGVVAILCGFCSVCLAIIELTRFYYAFIAYIRRLKVQIRK